MYGYIYKTTNLINGKIYIGQKHSNIFLGKDYLGSGKKLKCAINKYGIENFKVELIECLDSKNELDEREVYWINFYNSRDKNIGYNIAFGGNGGDVYHSLPESKQSKIKIKSGSTLGKIGVTRDGHRKYIYPTELEYYISIGYKEPKIYIKRKEIAERKRKYNELKEKELLSWKNGEHICKTCGNVMFVKYGNGLYCCKSCAATHKHTEETKSMISEYNKQGICGLKGRHLTEEHKKNLSIASKDYYSVNKYVWVTHNNEITKRIKEEELNEYILNGWVRGRKKGAQIPWNKGLTMDDPRVKNNIEKRNMTLLQRYGTLDCNIHHKQKKEN